MQSDVPFSLEQAEPSALLERMVAALPELPPTIRYYDDFDDKPRSISEVRQTDVFELHINGRMYRLDLGRALLHKSNLKTQVHL
ncbi:hypothetical protein [Ralstonia pseudosolanacearum]|uniref:hypothetical protein n=1 Tax=Ralstonia pseudosolanacearum TaxID=1310165 RepID=UPI0018D18323|nr:hypothetical protein [Ralstonia pseudosolanacearum]